MTGLTFEVRAVPAPQGSKRHVGGGRMVESSRKVAPWREAVRAEAVAAMHSTHLGDWHTEPIAVTVSFFLPRPQAHYGAKGLKPTAPTRCPKRPDLDKLLRSTLDALTAAGMYRDDNQVVDLRATKAYADSAPVGAVITVRPLTH